MNYLIAYWLIRPVLSDFVITYSEEIQHGFFARHYEERVSIRAF